MDGGLFKADDASQTAAELFSGKLGVKQALEKLRTRLLDLSMRNRLLNYKHPKARSFQFINHPNLDRLYEGMEEGKRFQISYVPDPPLERYTDGRKPDVRTYARELGISILTEFQGTTGALALGRIPDLQLAVYPADLEGSMRKLASEATTVVEETGTNMLHLMFGFLEYYDSEDSQKPVLAPLLSMPVTLEKGRLDVTSRTYIYTLGHSGEDISENFTLREKLRQQLRLELPELDTEAGPETYFREIEKAVSTRAKWRVSRRLTLGFLSFGKLAIWADLDPSKSNALLSSPLLKNIFEGGSQEASEAFHAEDYEIDAHPGGEEPLIYDADSSQHSALIDVKNGKSLVINGPPGTGKSQTITNIIASAIADGKKVLFVSEKLAALEVVKTRLEKAKLDDFCLELHSHKTQKKQLLENIRQRISNQYRLPAGYDQRLVELRNQRKELNSYAALMASKDGNSLDMSAHQVFWATESRRVALGALENEVLGIVFSGVETWTKERFSRARRAISDVGDSLVELKFAPQLSPWRGFEPDVMVRGDEVVVGRVIDQALDMAKQLVVEVSQLEAVLQVGALSHEELRAAEKALPALVAMPADIDGTLLARMFEDKAVPLDSKRRTFKELTSTLAQVKGLRQNALAHLVNLEVHSGDEGLQRAEVGLNRFLPEAQGRTAEALHGPLTVLKAALDELSRASAGRVIKIPSSQRSVREYLRGAMSDAANAQMVWASIAEVAPKAQASAALAERIKDQLTQLTVALEANGVPFDGTVDEVQALLDGTGLTELVPGAPVEDATIQRLKEMAATSWGGQTSGEMSSVAAQVGERVAAGQNAIDELSEFMKRLGLEIDTTNSTLQSIESLLEVAEEAPQELLGYRFPGLDRAEFADVAVRAGAAIARVQSVRGQTARHLHINKLPSRSDIESHWAVVTERGDSALKFLRSDWRATKRAIGTWVRTKQSLTPGQMQQCLKLAMNWVAESATFRDNAEFPRVLGALYSGEDTDFDAVHRLHRWHRSTKAKLLAGDFATSLQALTIPAAHLELLKANGARIRIWIEKLRMLRKAVEEIPGVDPTLSRTRRVSDILFPLTQHSKAVGEAATFLRTLVRPNVTASRALDLVHLRRRVSEHAEILKSLLHAPSELAEAGPFLGLTSSTLAYQDIQRGATAVSKRAQLGCQFAKVIAEHLHPDLSLAAAVEFLSKLDQVRAATANLFPPAQEAPGLDSNRLITELTALIDSAHELCRFAEGRGRAESTVSDVLSAASAAQRAEVLLRGLEENAVLGGLLGDRLAGTDTNTAAIDACLAWASSVHGVVQHLPAGSEETLLSEQVQKVAPAVARQIARARGLEASCKALLEKLREHGEFEPGAWSAARYPKDTQERLQTASEAASLLIPWSRYLAARKDAEKEGLLDLVELTEQEKLPPAMLVDAYEFVFFRALSKGILKRNKALSRFSGASHEKLREEFAALDKELIELTGGVYASKINKLKKLPPGVSTGRAKDLTEMGLLTKEMAKQRKHVPIRDLLSRAGNTLQQLKPCFMMGPLSVAQYLEQGKLSFDLVVMDEASQLRPEDALGAIARGSQLVVVGDPKQLPPTNFFDRLMDGDEEDDDAPAVVEGVDSILGICEHLYRPVRTLRWHYRSRHQSLIAFSNTQFYDNKLVVFPSPYKKNRRLGVNYRYVKEGVYQDRRNFPEAKQVVDAAIHHMLNAPTESLGIVTLNQTQRELVEELFEKESRSDPEVAKYLERHALAGWKFFIKNLENVQGDERDVIFVSTTFGRPPETQGVRQSFGPINRVDGWRRLNVLFTRARCRLDLFTSMLPADVVVDEKASLGRQALRGYLEYAKSGRLPVNEGSETGMEPDSEFEVSVSTALRNAGFDTEPQVGVAGYRIDIGVRHPDRPGEFLAAIECDGAAYHSSLSARDRDRIRQQILEGLGWRGRIIRVWSTDWFSNPFSQTERLVRFLNERMRVDALEPPPFRDEDVEQSIDDLEESAAEPGIDVEVAALVAEPSLQPVAEKLYVAVGDHATYEVDTEAGPERHTVRIVDSASNLPLGLLNERTPLASALLGMSAGDESDLEVPGKPVRTIRLISVKREPMAESVPG